MSNLSKYFQGNTKNSQYQGKNKQNNLSFRNIAATNQQYQSQIKINKVDKSFRSICDQSSSFYNSGQDLQQELNYNGSCFNHSNKLAQYFQPISQKQYCKLCAAKLASLGYTLQKSQNYVSRDISPTIHLNRHKQSHTVYRPKETSQSKIKHNTSVNSFHNPVKFSTIISQKNKPTDLQRKYQENEKIIEKYMEIYQQKMDRIEQIINDIRIKDTQYIKKLKAQNNQIYEQTLTHQQFQGQNGFYDLFGKSLLKQCNQNIRFNLPSQQRIQTLDKILQSLEQITSDKDKILSKNKIPLIKSITSNQSGKNTNQSNKNLILKTSSSNILKNSSSISNLSSKSNFKKQKKLSQNKLNSQINIKHFNNQDPIQSSRFSSNSAIVKKKNQSSNQIKTQSAQIKRANTQISEGESDSCQDTPQSIKSKISSNSFVLPKNAAVTMFEKINVCQSIDVTAQETSKQVKTNETKHANDKMKSQVNKEQKQQNSKRYYNQNKSCYTNKSDNISVASKSRKSFNRYQNMTNQQ